MTKTLKRIWLQDGGDYVAAREITWSDHAVNANDTEYIRADVARADAELAVAEALRRAAEVAASDGWPGENRLGVSEREEWARDCADRIADAILALVPADALAEVQRLRAERDAALARAEKAEQERDRLAAQLAEARAREQALRHQITEASDPDFIWGALDNVYDAETTLDDYAAAVSRAIRGAMQITGEAE
jgi:hypothetical protein